MIPADSYIVLQAYGSQDILNECAFALLTLSRQHRMEELAETEIWIYTDQPEFFQSFRECRLNLHFSQINHALTAQWRGAIDFVHRVKIEVLRDFAASREGQILYLDTDTCFSEPVADIFERIQEGKLFMHIMEGYVHDSDNAVFQKLSRFFKSRPVNVHGRNIDIPGKTTMWNAGVLGFHTRYSYLLEEILAFTDTVYRQMPKHVVEQFAFSLYFQQTAPLLTAHTAIAHYWNLKELRPILASFFHYFRDKNWDGLVYYSKLIQLPDLMQQKANFYHNRSTFDKLVKKHWHPREPEWALLAQQI